jgi:hypothetical protein
MSAAAEAAHSPAAETGPALAAPRWLLRRWLLRLWLLRRCGLKEKRSPPPVCTAAQTDHHHRRGRAAQQLAGQPPACTIKQGMAFRIYKQFMCSQKINTQNGESYICQKKFPRKILILESQRHQAVSPARNRLTRRPIQLRAEAGREEQCERMLYEAPVSTRKRLLET